MSPGRHRRPRSRRTLTIALAAAVLAVLVAATLLHRQLSTPDPATSEPPPAPSATPPTSHSPDGTAPTTDPASLSGLDAHALSWQEVCGVRLPVSPRHGPRSHDGTSEFAHTRAGAVLAAVHLLVRVSPQTGPDVFVDAIDTRVTGPDAAAFDEEVHRQYAQRRREAAVPYGEPLCPIVGTVVGVRLDSYTASAASMRLLLEVPDGDGTTLLSVLVQLTRDGEWMLVAPPQGDWSTVTTPQPDAVRDRFTALPTLEEGGG